MNSVNYNGRKKVDDEVKYSITFDLFLLDLVLLEEGEEEGRFLESVGAIVRPLRRLLGREREDG